MCFAQLKMTQKASGKQKHPPDSLIIIYESQTLDLDLMDNFNQLLKSTCMSMEELLTERFPR